MTPKLSHLPDNLLRCMDGTQRRAMGKAGELPEEREARQLKRAEREIQQDIAQFLRQRGLEFYQARMDRKTTGPVGWPDFTLCIPVQGADHGIPVALEAKVPGQKPRPEQERQMAKMRLCGWKVGVVHGVADVKQFLDALAPHKGTAPSIRGRVTRRHE